MHILKFSPILKTSKSNKTFLLKGFLQSSNSVRSVPIRLKKYDKKILEYKHISFILYIYIYIYIIEVNMIAIDDF